MFLQSFPGASAVMEENEDLDDEEEGNLEISTWTISLDVRLLGISTNQQGCHDIQQQCIYCMNYILYFVIFCFTLYITITYSYQHLPDFSSQTKTSPLSPHFTNFHVFPSGAGSA